MVQNKNRRLKIIALLSLQFITCATFAQSKATAGNTLKRPKLVVGIVVDQMRWDYLYRYYDRYSNGGFKRLMNEGFRCENDYINYLPSATAVGHSAIFSGTVPAINGIAGNDWVDQLSGKALYCVTDTTVNGVGSDAEEGKRSPRNLLSTTMTDELRLATNFKSKVVGVSLKDRASILPAGHMPTGAFWFDDESARFITSTYYTKELPAWVKKFNDANEPEKLVANGWNTLYPINTYAQSTEDNVRWEGRFAGETSTAFPHKVADAYKARHTTIRSTPFGNTLTLDFAKAAIEAYQLGSNGVTDFLTINCASTDYVGHMYGPNAIEVEDTYLRLDKDLADFFANLDNKLGKGNYTIFLTADHGASHSIEFNKEHNIPAGAWNPATFATKLNQMLKARFKEDKLVISITEYQVNFNIPFITRQKLDYTAIKQAAVDMLKDEPTVLFVADMARLNDASIPETVRTMMINGYNYKRSGAVMIIPTSGWFQGGATGTSHGEWNAYDTHIPLLFMGWGIKHGVTYDKTYTTDVASTISALLHIQVPSGNIGTPISAVFSGAENSVSSATKPKTAK
ncbi:alkaline phosphatase family protein [Mucilaginibacter mali]|uniref:Alkaline phosphatase family protein n=1 Tax=Mucilaginibacter mali TaxID=2740462 RepID=A0A7D4TKK0_9SPHI|nr:alkaline phosphatase PafA [Mucilaginibacter mali]QKJ28773.1 alkaline phosphatase family protein [Mucilaginibacter mali]